MWVQFPVHDGLGELLALLGSVVFHVLLQNEPRVLLHFFQQLIQSLFFGRRVVSPAELVFAPRFLELKYQVLVGACLIIVLSLFVVVGGLADDGVGKLLAF